MNDILKRIVEDKKLELAAEMHLCSLDKLRSQAENMTTPPRDFHHALLQPGVRIIAELKRSSPSKGVIRPELNVTETAQDLAVNGAAALSVLTEKNYFHGSLNNLVLARSGAPELPLLRKDFIFEVYQVYQSRVAGADAILLIAALLDDERYCTLANLASELGLAVLSEAHTIEEVERLNNLGAQIIGVNARNLHSFETSLTAAAQLLKVVKPGAIKVAESAITSSEDIRMLQSCGTQAFLIGETLMRAPEPGRKLRELGYEAS